MSRLFGIAGVQMFVASQDIQKNLTVMEDIVRTVTFEHPPVDLMLFSEYCLYGEPFPDWRKRAESIPGTLTDRLCRLARRYKKWLVPGTLYEREDDAVYNTAVVISPEGDIVTRYRKLFPWRPFEQTTAGKEFCVFDIPNTGRFGLCICYDMWFPEVCRTLAWMGAEVILHPTLTTTGDREQELVLARANAIFNQCYFIDVNGVGRGGVGRSSITDPHGRVVQSAGESAITLIEILDLDLVTTVREFGTAGINQHLKQLKAFQHPFPPYAQGIDKGDGFAGLGDVTPCGTIQEKISK